MTTTDPASMGGPLSEAEPLTEERLARIEHLWGGHQAYVREMLAEIRRLRAMKCATCGLRIGYLNYKGHLFGWACADGERCEAGKPHRFDTERGEVLVEDSWFKVEDLPDILGNFMRASAIQGREAKELSIKLAEARARVGVLEGQLATARALHQPLVVDWSTSPKCKASHGAAWVNWPCPDAVALGLDGGGSDE